MENMCWKIQFLQVAKLFPWVDLKTIGLKSFEVVIESFPAFQTTQVALSFGLSNMKLLKVSQKLDFIKLCIQKMLQISGATRTLEKSDPNTLASLKSQWVAFSVSKILVPHEKRSFHCTLSRKYH